MDEDNEQNNNDQGLGAPWDEEANENNIEIEIEDGNDRDANGDLDGGIAINPDGTSNSNRATMDCDLVLYLECEEELPSAPNHPIIKPGVTVFIGMDKNTKLSAVFRRFVEFCNDRQKRRDHIEVSELEFVHCQLLHGSDTAETSALMKNDRIKVRANRAAEREIEAERKRQQRAADSNFFDQMRILLPDKWNKYADVILDCKGTLVDDKGRNQKVLWTKVKAYIPIIKARCPWLYGIIIKSKSDALAAALAQQAALELTPNVEDSKSVVARVESEGKAVDDDEDDNSVEVMPLNPDPIDHASRSAGIAASLGANEIENDDEEDLPFEGSTKIRSESPVLSSEPQTRPSKKDLLTVTIENHSPEAMKLLLEYCYTHRVVVLGLNAFIVACKERPTLEKGPVPPLPLTKAGHPRYPQDSHPLVSFQVAVAGIELAEEARIPRLSLMCEVAAAQLVTSANVVRALSLCALQKSKTGNDLPKLRKAAMDVVLRSGSRGVLELGRTTAFRKALEEPRAIIIPTLLQGTTEAVTRYGKRGQSKRTKPNLSIYSFDELDRDDAIKRERERRKRRVESGRSYEIDEYGSGASSRRMSHDAQVRKRQVKKMSVPGGKTIARSGEYSNKRRSSSSQRRRSS